MEKLNTRGIQPLMKPEGKKPKGKKPSVINITCHILSAVFVSLYGHEEFFYQLFLSM